MEGTDYTKRSFFQFLTYLADKGLANPNTVAGLKAASGKLLEDLADSDDVRSAEPDGAVIRYNNKHPGELSPESLRQYRRRLGQAVEMFVQYKSNPTGFQPMGRVPRSNGGGDAGASKRPKAQPKKPTDEKVHIDHTAPAQPAPQSVPTLAMPYPLRTDFLAQLVVPRDMTTEEAKRLGGFLMTLAGDYRPQS